MNDGIRREGDFGLGVWPTDIKPDIPGDGGSDGIKPIPFDSGTQI